MATVPLTLEPGGRTLLAEAGSTLLDALRRGGIPVGSSCDGDLICGYCRLRILAGAAHLSPVEGEERRLLLRKGADPDERIACAARIQGPVTLTADYW